MKRATIISILHERKEELQRLLSRLLKDQKATKKEKNLGHMTDILESLSHQIGYVTGALEHNSQLLEMFEISDEEFWDRRRRSEESLEEIKKHFKNFKKQFKKDKR